MTRVGFITQARMSSSRLPGKILKKIAGKTLLEYHLERLVGAGWPVIVATTIEPSDDPVAELCMKLSLPVYRGSELDVLARFFEAAEKYKLDTVIRVTSDCPLIDSRLIKDSIERHLLGFTKRTYLSNCRKRTYPRGFDFEMFSFISLSLMMREANRDFEREHVTPYMWKSHPEKFEFIDVIDDIDNSDLRVTVDEEKDFELITKLITAFEAHKLSTCEIISLLRANQDLIQINRSIEQKRL